MMKIITISMFAIFLLTSIVNGIANNTSATSYIIPRDFIENINVNCNQDMTNNSKIFQIITDLDSSLNNMDIINLGEQNRTDNNLSSLEIIENVSCFLQLLEDKNTTQILVLECRANNIEQRIQNNPTCQVLCLLTDELVIQELIERAKNQSSSQDLDLTQVDESSQSQVKTREVLHESLPVYTKRQLQSYYYYQVQYSQFLSSYSYYSSMNNYYYSLYQSIYSYGLSYSSSLIYSYYGYNYYYGTYGSQYYDPVASSYKSLYSSYSYYSYLSAYYQGQYVYYSSLQNYKQSQYNYLMSQLDSLTLSYQYYSSLYSQYSSLQNYYKSYYTPLITYSYNYYYGYYYSYYYYSSVATSYYSSYRQSSSYTSSTYQNQSKGQSFIVTSIDSLSTEMSIAIVAPVGVVILATLILVSILCCTRSYCPCHTQCLQWCCCCNKQFKERKMSEYGELKLKKIQKHRNKNYQVPDLRQPDVYQAVPPQNFNINHYYAGINYNGVPQQQQNEHMRNGHLNPYQYQDYQGENQVNV